ncbi:MAG: hypothetical protein AAFV46_10915 [Cyanobacteria bacterium J06635_11]
MAYRWGTEVDCMTCCKLLGLKPVIDKETGGQTFEPDRDRKNLTTEYDLVVVDECSMINAGLRPSSLQQVIQSTSVPQRYAIACKTLVALLLSAVRAIGRPS